MNTITAGDASGSTTPTLILEYVTARQSRTIVHDTLDGGIAVSTKPARPRAGTLRLFYPVEGDAIAALNLFARDTTYTLSTPDRPSLDMTFVTEGNIELELNDETRHSWRVSVGYQEVAP